MEGTRHCGSSSVSIANNNSNSTARAAALQQGTNSSSFGGQPRSEYDMSSYGAPLHTLTHMDEPSSTTTTRLFSSPNTSFPSWSLQPPPNSTTTPPLHWLLSRCVTPQEEEEEQAAAAAASPQLALPAPPAPALSTCFSGNTTLSIELKPSNDDSGGAPFNHSALKKQRHSLSHSRVGAFRHRHIARCHVDGCKADLSAAKDYHRRHKVCEMHSKATKVMAGGVEQRFCQQCSRFHTLSEFDDSKRSCRKRLAGHNERRRKSSRDPTTVSLAAASGVLSCNGASLLLSQSCYPHLQNPLGSSHFVFGNGEGLTEEAFNGIISSPSWPRLVEEKLAISHNILGQKQDPSLSSHSSAGMMVPQSSSLSPGISNLVGRALSLLSSTSPVEAAATMHSPSHHHALFAPTHHRSSDGSLDISVKKEHEGSDGSTLKEMLLLQGPQAHHYHNYQQQQQYNQNHSHQLKFGAAGGGNLRMMLMHEQQMEGCLNNNSNRVPSYSSSSLLAQPDRHPKAHPIL